MPFVIICLLLGSITLANMEILTKSMPYFMNPIKKIISKPMIFTCLVHLDIALLSKKQTFPTIFYEQPKKSGRRPTYHKISEFTMRFNDPRQC